MVEEAHEQSGKKEYAVCVCGGQSAGDISGGGADISAALGIVYQFYNTETSNFTLIEMRLISRFTHPPMLRVASDTLKIRCFQHI